MRRPSPSPDGARHDLDPFILEVAASGGVGADELRAAVDRVCGR